MFFEKRLRNTLLATVSASSLIVGSNAFANPEGAVVISGDVTIDGAGTGNVVIQNNSNRAIVNFDSFSIGVGETTTINQITNDSAILNRVVGNNPSEIFGTLRSNGQVFLINQSGILVGETGIIETNGFVASTLDVSNDDFLNAGELLFKQGVEVGGGIEVHGKIRSVTGGDIFLLSREITIGETAEIKSEGGYVGLGAGEEILLKPVDSGDGRISIRAGKGRIINRGHIEAAAVELQAAGGNEYALAINNTGVVRATGYTKSSGKIRLGGGKVRLKSPGKIRNSGKIVARKKVVVRSKKKIINKGTIKAGDGNQGGEIIFEAPEITIEADSVLDVSGALGGGRIFVGGGFQGTTADRDGNDIGITETALNVTVDAGAVLTADATESGDAGDIIIWSENTTSFEGEISANAADGVGGFAEVSGKENLIFKGNADLRGSEGFGTLLLDPGGIDVVDGALGTSAVNTLADADIEAALGFANVIITTSAANGLDTDNADNDNDNTTGQNVTGITDAGTGDVDFAAGVSIVWNGATTFEVNAERDINALDDVFIQNTQTSNEGATAGFGNDATGENFVLEGQGGVVFLAANNINIGSGPARTDAVVIGSEFGQNIFVAGDSDFNRVADQAGNITLTANTNGTIAGTGQAHLGYEQTILRGNNTGNDIAADDLRARNGDILVRAGGSVILNGGVDGDGGGSFALIGHGGDGQGVDADVVESDITINAGVAVAGDVTLIGGRNTLVAELSPIVALAKIGHGAIDGFAGNNVFGSLSGDISITTGNDGDLNINSTLAAGATAGDDNILAQVGHGHVLSTAVIVSAAGDFTSGRVDGDIAVDLDGDLNIGQNLTPVAGDSRIILTSRLGHGSTVNHAINVTAGNVADSVAEFTFSDIGTGTSDDNVAFTSNIRVDAGSINVLATEATENSAGNDDDNLVDNVQFSQIGHGNAVSVLEDRNGANQGVDNVTGAAFNYVIRENRIAGNITVTDTDTTDAAGVNVQAGITGTDTATNQDYLTARIGHASQHIVEGLDGNLDNNDVAFNASNVTVFQAHILNADILVDTVSSGAAATDNQDISVVSSIASALTEVTDSTAVAQIGHGADTIIQTGDGFNQDGVSSIFGGAGAPDTNSSDGGDITIYQGTVWDGGLVRDNDGTAITPDSNDALNVTNTTNITILSSNDIIVDSDTASSDTAPADRNSAESQIGHGFKTRLATGNGGTSSLSGADGGAGGDILIVQALDAREYGIDQNPVGLGQFDGFAQGIRGDIRLTASESDGTVAISITGDDTSAAVGTENNVNLALVGHNSVIEAVSGDGGAGGGLGIDNDGSSGAAVETDSDGDDIAADPLGQVSANGGRGGHIDIQLGRLTQTDGLTRSRAIVSEYTGARNRADVVNLADIGDSRQTNLAGVVDEDLQGVSLIEGDISVTATGGHVEVTSTVTNADAPSERALVDANIGHGFQVSAFSGDGGTGGEANFLATDQADNVDGFNNNPTNNNIAPSAVYDSELDGERGLADQTNGNAFNEAYNRTNGAARGGNGGDIRVTVGDITDRLISDRDGSGNAEISHETDADRGQTADITITVTDDITTTLPDSLIVRSTVGAGAVEGTGSDVYAGVGARVRLFGEGGAGQEGGSTNTEFDNEANSLFENPANGQTDTQTGTDIDPNNSGTADEAGDFIDGDDGFDETALQAGAVGIQPNVSGGRGGDVLLGSGNINGNVVVNAARRVTVDSVAGHGTNTRVIAGIGHATDLVAVTQSGAAAGNLVEPEAGNSATFDGGIINIDGDTTENIGATNTAGVTLPGSIVLVDGNEDDQFNLAGVGDSNSTVDDDGVAVTVADIENRQGSTFASINNEFGTVDTVVETGTTPGGQMNIQGFEEAAGSDAVIFHDEEADPQFIFGIVNGRLLLVENTEANNEEFAENAANLARFGRLVAAYDGLDNQPAGENFFSIASIANTQTATPGARSLEVFVDIDRDGDVDFVDFDRDGRLDVVDVDRDGRHDVIDGRANYVGVPETVNSIALNSISGLGVLDYVAVTGNVETNGGIETAFSVERQLTSTNAAGPYAGVQNLTDNTALVGDFSIANGGRGGDAATVAGYSVGDITVSTGDDDTNAGTSLVVSSTVFDGVFDTGGEDDFSRAAIGHSAYQVSDTSATFADHRSGREGLSGAFDAHVSADGGDASQIAINASGGRGGNAAVLQGALRDTDARLDVQDQEADHLLGNVTINSANAMQNTVLGDEGRIDILSTTSGDASNNESIAAIGHQTDAHAFAANTGGDGVSVGGGEDTSSQTEIARGGDGGEAFIGQAQIKGATNVRTGADDNDAGTPDFSLVINASHPEVTPPGGSNDIQVAQIGAGRRAFGTSGSGGTGDDGQLNADGGNAGNTNIQQALVIDSAINVDLFDTANGFYGNGAQILSSINLGENHTVRAQIGHSNLSAGFTGNGGNGAVSQSEVIEQLNQTANGGDGGDIRIDQSGYLGDISVDLGSNLNADVEALQIISDASDDGNVSNNQQFSGIGHGGGTIRYEGIVSTAGVGGDSGTRDGTYVITSDLDPNLVDTDFDFNNVGNTPTTPVVTGVEGDEDTPFPTDIGIVDNNAADLGNQITLGTIRRGGDGGDVTLNINNIGFDGGATDGAGNSIAGIGDQTNGTSDPDNARAQVIATTGFTNGIDSLLIDDNNGANINVTINDEFVEGQMPTFGFDGVVVRSIAGPGSNETRATDFNLAQIGHSAFADGIAGAGGLGIQSIDTNTISEGDGGDGGSASVATGAIYGDVNVSNIGGNNGATLDNSANTRSTDILIEAIGAANDTTNHKAEARAGHLTAVRAESAEGGNASREPGGGLGFTATISAQGGDGGDATTFQGQLTGNVTLTAENTVHINSVDNSPDSNVTVAAAGHRLEGRANAEDASGGFGGTVNDSNFVFTFEALREFQYRRLNGAANDAAAFGALSSVEQQLVAPVTDYFENKPGELVVFLNTLVGDNLNEIAANTRDDDAIGATNFTFATPGTTADIAAIGGGDGEVQTLQAILAASGHGGNASVTQGGVGLNNFNVGGNTTFGSFTDELATSGNISLNASSFDTGDADRGIRITTLSDALGIGFQFATVGHQAEAYEALAGAGENLIGQVSGANGIGGDGGDAIVDQYGHNGSITLTSSHEIAVRSTDNSLAAHQTFSTVGHRTNLGSDVDVYRNGVAVAGNGGSETADAGQDIGRNGNGGDVKIYQRGIVSGEERPDTTTASTSFYNTDIVLSALQDSDNDDSIFIESEAIGLSAGEVETRIGHNITLYEATAGDAGLQGPFTGPDGASQGLLEGNGGDIFVLQSDLGSDIDIAGKDEVIINASSNNGDPARVIIGHERNVAADNLDDSTLTAGLGTDAFPEQANNTTLASIPAAAAGIIEDGDSGLIEVSLGILGDRDESAGGATENTRQITITSITEDVTITTSTADGSTSDIDIGNIQELIALTQEAGQFTGDPLIQTAGDVGGISVASGTIFGDVLIQALDADRTTSVAMGRLDTGRQVFVEATTGNSGTSDLDIGHQIDYNLTTGNDITGGAGTGFGEDRNALFTTNLPAFTALANPADAGTTILTNPQATFGDAQNAVEDIANVERVIQIIVDEYSDRFPADDQVAETEATNPGATDIGELNALLTTVENALLAAQNALNATGPSTGDTVAERVETVQTQATAVIAAATEVQALLADAGVVPNASDLFADPSEGGDIIDGTIAGVDFNIGANRSIASISGTDLIAQDETVTHTGIISGNVDILSGRVAAAVNVNNVISDDTVVASQFGDAADTLDDNVVLIRSQTGAGGTADLNIGHTTLRANETSTGGGETDGGSDDGGVVGNGGDIITSKTVRGDVTVQAEEVVVTALGGGGRSDVHLLHDVTVTNEAGQSDIETRVGNGGDITNTTTVNGGATINAERIASDVDAMDRTLLATGAANSFIQLGHEVTTTNTSESDETIGGTGDSQDNLGANRGGNITSTQTVTGSLTDGDLVTITLDAAGDGNASDLIIQTAGSSISNIRLGSGNDNSDTQGIVHTGFSGVNDLDDGGAVTLTQRVSGDIEINTIEDLEINALGSAANDIHLGHDTFQFGQSGEPNGGTAQYGERVTVTQAVSGNVSIATTSSFRAQITANSGELHIGHEAVQIARSADDSADPSDFEDQPNGIGSGGNGIADNPIGAAAEGPSAGGVNDNFNQPDVLATQTVDAGISIVTGEITLENASGNRLHVGHEAFITASADDGPAPDNFDGTNAAVTGTSVANGSTGHVVSSSIINGDGSDIIFTATGVATTNDGIVAPVNGVQGDIQLEGSSGADIQVGHRSTSTQTDGAPVAEGQYNTLQAIGSAVLNAAGTEVVDTTQSVIQFTAVQDIVLASATGETQVGHFIVELGTLQTQATDVDGNEATGLAEGDSELRQIIGSDIVFGSNANQGSGGVGTGGAGNNLIIETGAGAGRAQIGHRSTPENQFQVENAARSVTVQLLDGDITVEAGTDAGVDAPDGMLLADAAAAIADEMGFGDDILILSGGGTARIGHDIAGGDEGVNNETQRAAGDISVRAGGDLHVLGGQIGHENYDTTIGTSAASGITTSTPESLALMTPIRDRIRGNTTIGAGQNSAAEDTTLISDVLVFDGSTVPVTVNSGYGGIGNADVDGELRFFLPAQEGLTIVPGVVFNDSASNGDATVARQGLPDTIFMDAPSADGNDHEHFFEFFSENATYSDLVIGAGNFGFYFEPAPVEAVAPVAVDPVIAVETEFTPFLIQDFNDTGFKIIITDGETGVQTAVNIDGLDGFLGTSSIEIACEEAGLSAEDCSAIAEELLGQRQGFGSNVGFSGGAGGNGNIILPSTSEDDEIYNNGIFGFTLDTQVSGATAAFTQTPITAPVNEINFNNDVDLDDVSFNVPSFDVDQVSIKHTESFIGTAVNNDFNPTEIENTYGSYVSSAGAEEHITAAYPGALSYSSSYLVFESKVN